MIYEELDHGKVCALTNFAKLLKEGARERQEKAVILETRAIAAANDLFRALDDLASPLLFSVDPNFKKWTGVDRHEMKKLDRKGCGPTGRILVGGRVAYRKDAVIDWVRSRITPAQV
jgi:hypothetical protein